MGDRDGRRAVISSSALPSVAIAGVLLVLASACGQDDGAPVGGPSGAASMGTGGNAAMAGLGGGGGQSGSTAIASGGGMVNLPDEAGAPAAEGGSTTEAGGAPAGKVPAFIAQGHLGRTTISCDDGHTWIHNHSIDDTQRCFEGTLDCDHSADAGRGITYGNGWFVVTWAGVTPERCSAAGTA